VKNLEITHKIWATYSAVAQS